MSRPTVAVPDDYPPVLARARPSRRSWAALASACMTACPPRSRSCSSASPQPMPCLTSARPSPSGVRVRRLPQAARPVLWGTGTDHVDLRAAKAHGVTVTNTPGVSAVAMAEHALALMLAVARDIPRIDAKTRKGAWPRGFVTQLHGKTLGLVGLGAIGLQTARIARGIGMRVIAWTRTTGGKPLAELGSNWWGWMICTGEATWSACTCAWRPRPPAWSARKSWAP